MPENRVEIDRLRVELLFGQGVFAQLFGLLCACIYVVIAKEVVPLSQLLLWLLLVGIVYLSRFAFVWWFTRKFLRPNRNFDPKLYEKVFSLGTFVSGACWGLVGAMIIPAANPTQEAFLGFLLAGLTAGAAISYFTSILAVQSFVLPAVLPFAIRLSFAGTTAAQAVGGSIVLYLVMMGVAVFKTNKVVLESMRLKFENVGLLKELRETQSKITHSAKMAALGEMAGGLAHEINTPLGVLQFNVDALSKMIRETDENVSMERGAIINLIGRQERMVARIAKIVRGLRSFAREGENDLLQPFSVQEILVETLDLCQTRFKNNQVSLEVAEVLPDHLIHCSAVQVSQALLNLLNNAFDAVVGKPDAMVKIAVERQSLQTVISVSDNGGGVPADLRDKIMQPFFTTKDVGKGTGLGLSISLGIVQKSGGQLSLDHQFQGGARFVMSFPNARGAGS